MWDIILIFVNILVAIQTSQAVKCYQCIGLTDGDSCADPFKKDSSLEYDCGSSVKGCLKATAKGLGMLNVLTHTVDKYKAEL